MGDKLNFSSCNIKKNAEDYAGKDSYPINLKAPSEGDDPDLILSRIFYFLSL